ncbi:DNA adenine methylase [Armatimonas sp.]|uniref:DNA adenine methylase n=1 Tax=Armatimonas sp. TaxID=1872638 RepID=UPI00375140F7
MKPSPKILSEPAYQYSLFDEQPREAIVNVSSVPQRSPFRYPGGKTWLVPRLRRWLLSQPQPPCEFVEPFAGGGILSLTVAFERLAERVTMVERDPAVAAVWNTILYGDAECLARRIVEFSFSESAVAEILATEPESTLAYAFQTILRNRVNHGGILAPGSGKLKAGENGRGMASRWYPQTLANRIIAIGAIASRICFIEGDGLTILEENADRYDAVFLLDPPYTAPGKRAGARLYTYSELDHNALFRLSARIQGDFLMTYDNTESVQVLAQEQNFATLAIPMKNTHHAAMTELLIGRDLRWA